MSQNQDKSHEHSASSLIGCDEKSYPFYLWSGILTPKHRKQMGSAIWVFLWCLRRTTTEENGIGKVLGSTRIKLERIAYELGVCERGVQKDLAKLKRHGYVQIRRIPYGLVITVPKSKRGFNAKRKEQTFLSEKGTNVPISSERKEQTFRSGSEGSFRYNREKAVGVNKEKRGNSGSASPHRKASPNPSSNSEKQNQPYVVSEAIYG